MQFSLITLVALFATAWAVPADQATQKLCIGLNDEKCINGTLNMSCCEPLVCGSDSRCHEPYGGARKF